jgi:beta-lactamase superfamily II metal-dependent hydrolase
MLKLLTLALALSTAAARSQAPLKITFIDVEGGQSTLFITPTGQSLLIDTGQSLLIDTGWPGNENRDADRILKAAHQAGITRLDYVLLTHYHVDHTGGVPQLVAKIPVGTFIDHGPNRELDHGITEKDYADYQSILATGKYKHITARPGDHLPIPGLDATVISADGDLIAAPLRGAGQPNPYCATSEIRPADQTENSRSLGIEITFGKLKILDLGDLTWDKERTLMCPANKLGHVDILVVSHHGWYQSSSPALVNAITPRVAIMDNGEQKGGSTPTLKTFHKIPGLEALWQLHYSDEGAALNTGEPYIANLKGTDPGNSINLEANKDGSFQITNTRTAITQTYAPKP